MGFNSIYGFSQLGILWVLKFPHVFTNLTEWFWNYSAVKFSNYWWSATWESQNVSVWNNASERELDLVHDSCSEANMHVVKEISTKISL